MKKVFSITLGILSILAVSTVAFMGTRLVLPQFQFAAINESTESESDQAEINTQPSQEETQDGQKKVSRLSFDEHMLRGDTLAKNGYVALAVKEYIAATHTNPEKAAPYVKIGKLELKKNNLEKAEENFKIALEKKPNDYEIITLIAQTLVNKKEIEQAKTLFDKSAEHYAKAAYYQGVLAAYREENEISQQKLQEIINTSNDIDLKTKAQTILDAYTEFKQFQEGSKTHLKTLLARSFNQVGEYVLASELLYQVLRELPEYRDAWILLGYSFLRQENFLDAKNSFEHALKTDPEKPETHYFLGLAYFGLDNTNKAILHLEIALQNQFKPEIHVKQKLAEIYLLKQDYENAAKYYEQILENPHTTSENYIRPVWIWIEHLKQPHKALSISESLLEKHPDDAMSYNLLGWSELANKNTVAAKQYLEKALEMNPNLDAAYLNLGMLYEKTGDLEKAKENYKKAYNLGQGNSIANLAAEKYNNLSSVGEAH